MVSEAYGKLQEEVAREVKAGRRDEAVGLIRKYRAANAPMNDRLKSAPVAKQLESLDKLEADVGAAFTGPNAPAQQNVFSKRSSAEARDQRRAGAKREAGSMRRDSRKGPRSRHATGDSPRASRPPDF